MLFNSYEFIFVFLPAVIAVYFVLGRSSRAWALRWIVVASLIFYGSWRPLNVLIIAPSVLINFLLARLLQRLGKSDNRRAARAVLVLGIVFNVAFLGYFKYTNFLVGAINDAFGTQMVLAHIILPLGLSFISFQKIAFLVDVHAGRIDSFTLEDYCLFVLFFPQLIAGPIVHYREVMPQFRTVSCRFDKDKMSVGLTLFAFGLFKKVFIADRIMPLVQPIYVHAAGGSSIGLLSAWIAAVGFTLQIYFDFSAYTDMALGIARMFGVRLPPNFDSPLKASNIIDFWLRWHMTLTRFLTAYIYNPLTLWLMRRRATRSPLGFVAKNKGPFAFVELLMFPTLLTMFVCGMWHGAGYTFIIWGVVHGFYLTLNHAWRSLARKLWHDRSRYERFMGPIGWVVTFASVAASMVIFRATSLKSAGDLLQGMLGLHGIGLSQWKDIGVGRIGIAFGIAGPAFIALLCPNTLEILSRYGPAWGWKPRPQGGATVKTGVLWTPSLAWAVVVSMAAAIAILYLGGRSEFLYWQF